MSNRRLASEPPANIFRFSSSPSTEGSPSSDHPNEEEQSVETLAKSEHDAKLLHRLPSPDLVQWVAFPPIGNGKVERPGIHMAYQSEPDGSRTRVYAVLSPTSRVDKVSYFKVDLTSEGVATAGIKVHNLHSLQLPWPFSKKQDLSKSSQPYDNSFKSFCTFIVRQLALNCNVSQLSDYSETSRRRHEDHIRKIVDQISDDEAEEANQKWRDFFRESSENDSLTQDGGVTNTGHERHPSQGSNEEETRSSAQTSYHIPPAHHSMEPEDIVKEKRRVMILTSFTEWKWKIGDSAKMYWPEPPPAEITQFYRRFYAYAIRNPQLTLEDSDFKWLEETSTHLHSIGITMDIGTILQKKLHANQEEENIDLMSLPVENKSLFSSWISSSHPHNTPDDSMEQRLATFIDRLIQASGDGSDTESEFQEIHARLVDKFKHSGDFQAFEQTSREVFSEKMKLTYKDIARELMDILLQHEGKKGP